MREDGDATAPAMKGTIHLHDRPVDVLFDSGASHSFICADVVAELGLVSVPLDDPFIVHLPNGEYMRGNSMIVGYPIVLEGRQFIADLIILPMMPQDVILGMDWLLHHGASIDFERRAVTLSSDGQFVCKFRGHVPSKDGQVINVMQAVRLLRQGCMSFLCYLQEPEDKSTILSDIPIAREFPDVFPEEIVGLPPQRFVEFGVDS